MSNKGTSEAEQSLNVPKSEDELADQILLAVSEGNEEEMERLFSIQLEPDVTDEEEEGSEEDPSGAEEEEEEGSSEDDSPAEEVQASESPTQQELSPAEQRLAKLEKELADARAAVGRTASLSSRLAQLENQLKKAEANKKKAEADDVDSKLRERINKLKEVDPETGELFEELVARQPKPTQDETADDGPDPKLTEEYYKVLTVHADADKVFNHPYWHMWKQQLTPQQRAWAESTDSQEVIVAVDEFKKFLGGFNQPAPVATEVKEEVVDATKEARDKKLQRSAESSDTPVKKSKTFDADAFLKESMEKIAKEAGIY